MFQGQGSQIGYLPVLGNAEALELSDLPMELEFPEGRKDKTGGEAQQETDDHDPVNGNTQIGFAEEVDVNALTAVGDKEIDQREQQKQKENSLEDPHGITSFFPALSERNQAKSSPTKVVLVLPVIRTLIC
jgi:hypothetical protein